MKKLYADANIFLRYFLKDNQKQLREVEEYLFQAKSGKLSIIVISEVIPEIEYVLRKTHGISRDVIYAHMSSILQSPYIVVEHRDEWVQVLEIYQVTTIDIIDIM